MPKDYAKHVNKSKRPSRVKHGWRKRLLLVVFLFLLCIIGAFSIYVYQEYQSEVNKQTIAGWMKRLTSFVITPKEQGIIKSTPELPAKEAGQEEDIQFSFYTNLAAMQVPAKQIPVAQKVVESKGQSPVLPKPEISPVAPVVTIAAPAVEKYLLQIAAFRNPTAAGEMRISLLLAGFEAEIVKALNNNQQIYQLQQGPFRSVAEARTMQRELKNKGIESVIIKKIE